MFVVRYIKDTDIVSLKKFLKSYQQSDENYFCWIPEKIRGELPLNNHIGVFEDGDMIGMCTIRQDKYLQGKYNTTAVLLSDVYINKEKRGQGRGSKLVNRAVELAQEKYPNCDIYLSIIELKIRPFYEKLGFEFIGSGKMRRTNNDVQSAQRKKSRK